MHPLAYARGSVTLAESMRLLLSRDRQGAGSSEIPKQIKNPSCPFSARHDSGCGRMRHSMRFLDLAVILAYLIAITWFGARFRKGQTSQIGRASCRERV